MTDKIPPDFEDANLLDDEYVIRAKGKEFI